MPEISDDGPGIRIDEKGLFAGSDPSREKRIAVAVPVALANEPSELSEYHHSVLHYVRPPGWGLDAVANGRRGARQRDFAGTRNARKLTAWAIFSGVWGGNPLTP